MNCRDCGKPGTLRYHNEFLADYYCDECWEAEMANLKSPMGGMKTLGQQIAIMKSYQDGKDIEVDIHYEGDWVLSILPAWDWGRNDYRVAQEPLVIYKVVRQRDDGTEYYDGCTYETLERAKVAARKSYGVVRVAKLVEEKPCT